MLTNTYESISTKNSILKQRITLWYTLLIIIFGIFTARLFYLQVFRHDYYQRSALLGQLKQYDIPAERGTIRALDGSSVVPLVLNEKRYNIIADPKLIKDPSKSAEILAPVLSLPVNDLISKLSENSRYVILAKKQTKDVHVNIKQLDLIGVFEDEVTIRTYPQGELASQLLGFVDDSNKGRYGVEESLDALLRGQDGRLKAITDQKGVPLLASGDNILIDPTEGDDVVLTIDVGMQRQLEDILKSGLDAAKSKSGSALILEAKTGAIKAMANYPTYSPSEFSSVADTGLFLNASVSAPLEVGSIMKPLTAAAALQYGVVTKDSTYYDPSRFKVDDATINNIEEDGGAGVRSIADILQLSLNTGATWLLMQMGGGQINYQARTKWYDFMTKQYGFGSKTGIEQGYEEAGIIPSPTEGYGLNIRYANTAFGQGMTATPLQMGAALAAVINDGTYYKPRLVQKTISKVGFETIKKPEVVRTGVVTPQISKEMRDLMNYVVQKNNRPAVRNGYTVGGKTGTAEIAKEEGGYYKDRYNGTYLGFVGKDNPQYVIVVRVNEPGVAGYAGAQAAAPLFAALSNMLIDSFNVSNP
ncbi:penicillin-binding protein 2 [bacterium]|nr:penicillin-binding protein 2 [bacterium]NBX97900.1 penicillin-binding protein 2 [bacterium]NDC93860.1 penicillin-binding protein 2 [bacterium]NDD82807.1 penicillin-binding protein 2 [bacterium]NDG28744.1 penicillin-binding protein 2 [bacterium]